MDYWRTTSGQRPGSKPGSSPIAQIGAVPRLTDSRSPSPHCTNPHSLRLHAFSILRILWPLCPFVYNVSTGFDEAFGSVSRAPLAVAVLLSVLLSRNG